jgi:hypothetical protein
MNSNIHQSSSPYHSSSNHQRVPGRDNIFFTRLVYLITFVIFGGFIFSWVINPEQFGRISMWAALHGALAASWFLLLILQLHLSKKGKMTTHKTLGSLSIVLVIAMLVTGAILTLDLYARLAGFGMFDPNDAAARIRAGGFIGGAFMQWSVFAVLYILALLNIANPTHHKRFMVAAAIQLMPEGLNRLIHGLGLPGYFMLLVIFVLYVAIMVYDWKSDKKIHVSTLVSFGLFTLLVTLMWTVFKSQTWGDWVVSIVT